MSADPGGQWTRDDLPKAKWLYTTFLEAPGVGVEAGFDDLAVALTAHMNAHHPKPGVQWCANKDEVDAALRSELMGVYGQRDRLRVLLASAADERDAAAARAIQMGRELATCGEEVDRLRDLNSELQDQLSYARSETHELDNRISSAVARAEKAEARVRSLEAAPARSTWCPKILLELLRAQSIYSPDEVTGDAIQTLDRVIAQHRPVGPDGKHGDRHTASCGCEDIGAVYPVVDVQSRAAVADTKLEDEAVSHAYWAAKQLGCHVDDLDELTLVEMSQRVFEKAERDRDEADRRTAAAEADRDRWKLHHDRVDGQWAKAEREVTRLRGTGAVTRADIEKAIRPAFEGWATQLEGPMDRAVDRLWALHEGADRAVHVVWESDVAAVKVERVRDEEWHADGTLVAWTGESAEDVRGQQDTARRNFIHREAVARAIEAEQAVDPVEAKARELYEAVRIPDWRDWDQLPPADHDEYYRLAAHVLGQEASSDE